jgi:membrane protease YdiL (CAAX protease family)
MRQEQGSGGRSQWRLLDDGRRGGLTIGQEERGPFLILLVVPVLLMVWVYFGKQGTYDQIAGVPAGYEQGDVCRTVYEYLAAFVLMFVIPALVVRAVLKRRLCEYGVRLGDARYGLRFVALALPLLLLMAFLGSKDSGIQSEYPLARGAMQHALWFVLVEVFYLVYYLGWEFFFRGLMLFGLEERYGAVLAILVQTIPSTIVHIGKPASEAFAAIGAGLLFGYLAVRTRSILYPFLLHAAVGVGTDLFVALQML